uniref:HNH endonuclease signature motif containing protein n=1 Tax=Pseudovibrio sp. W64 TaxID=1735583 RepID=UPI0009EE66C9|nr:HNH endonuclease [Pseudovibrio sp. W64]
MQETGQIGSVKARLKEKNMTVSKTAKPSRVRDCYMANQHAGHVRTPKGFTWHHDGANPGTLQLVDSSMHNAFPHSGGVSVIKEQLKNG